MLKTENTLLLVIDVQEKLFRVMHGKEALLINLSKLIRGCRLLGIPALVTEQNPAGLGPTIPEIAALLPDAAKALKFSFSCCAETGFIDQLKATGRRQILVCGIESHVCVYQTASDLLAAGYEVQVVSDGVSSRTPQNKELALRRLASEGAKLTGVEMALFELLRTAKAEQFKAVSALIKE
jgi:nicotinamidase-related amidase